MKRRDLSRQTASIPFEQHDLMDRLSYSAVALLQVVCPLLFFTNLTRNPYYTQIVLLNILIILPGIFWVVKSFRNGSWEFFIHPLELPLLIYLAVALWSTLHSWIVHPTVRSGIVFEGSRVWVFTIVNCFMAFYLPFYFSKPSDPAEKEKSIAGGLVFSVIWGAAWFLFHSLKDQDPAAVLWDTYGGFLWTILVIYAIRVAWDGRASSYLRLIFSVSVIAGCYGIMQYVGRDIIWSSPVAPYGGRPVSTFGNPNFLSSYVMMVAPLAAAKALSVDRKNSWGYWIVSIICIISTLTTLTRSSYMGLFAAFLVMGIFFYSPKGKPATRKALVFFGILVLLIVVFPKTPVNKTQSPLERFIDIVHALKRGEVYSPWHQRLLIWSSAWDMVKERPFFGKGWGCFELFYPFYQGRHVLNSDLGPLRTHANNAHNILLEFLSQVGIVGTGVVLWIFFVIIHTSVKAIKEAMDNRKRLLLTGLFAGMIGMVVDNFFGNVSFFFAVPAFLFWWVAGNMFHESNQTRKVMKSFSPAAQAALAVSALMLFLMLGVYNVSRWMQERYYFEGFKYAKIDRIPESVTSLERAFNWFPGEVNGDYELGNSYARYARQLADQGAAEKSKKYINKSENAYKWALKANPGYDEIYFNLGIIQYQNGEEDEAIKNLETALVINPLLDSGYGTLGNIYLKRGQYDEAIRVFQQATELHPMNKDYWNNLGFAYAKTGIDNKAFDAFKNAVQIDPALQQAWVNLATCASKTGRTDPVLKVPGLIKQMEVDLAQKNYSGAKSNALKLVELLPKNPDAHLSLGNIFFYLNDLNGSVQELEKAISLRPDFAVAHVNVGKILISIGKKDEGRQHLIRALELNPQDDEVKKILASLPK